MVVTSADNGAPAGSVGPTLRRRILASRLRELRRGAGLTLEDVAAKLLVSPTKISRLENDERAPRLRDVRDLATLYKVGEAGTAELIELAEGARERAWWQAFDTLSAPEKTYIGMEAAASSVQAVDLLLIHGLIQTSAYAEALLERLGPAFELGSERLKQIAESRTLRQRRLKGTTPVEVEIVIGEAALVTEVGSTQVMSDQLSHLLEVSLSPNVALRVMPFSAGATAAHGGSFGILGFRAADLTAAVYLEGLAGQLILDDQRHVDQYRASFIDISARALTPETSREFMERTQVGWQSHSTEPGNNPS
jgi:transcriptional regulator with XRE-family HTH domain